MTTPNRQHTTRNTRATLLVASVLSGALILTGCTTPEAKPTSSTPAASTPPPTPTPTSTKAAEPQTENEAIAGATAAINRFFEIRGEVNASGGKNPKPLEAVATGPALTIVNADAKRLADGGKKSTGRISYTIQTAYASPLKQGDKVVSYGTVTTNGCQDGSNYKLFDANGQPAQQPSDNSIITMTVIYEPTDSTWLVQNITATGVKC